MFAVSNAKGSDEAEETKSLKKKKKKKKKERARVTGEQDI